MTKSNGLRRKRDRFTRQMLSEYLHHFGIALEDVFLRIDPSTPAARLQRVTPILTIKGTRGSRIVPHTDLEALGADFTGERFGPHHELASDAAAYSAFVPQPSKSQS